MKRLSPRLLMCASLVSPGNYITDVGCDHAGLSIYLVESGICPGACCSEVAEGPLSNAREAVEEAGLADRIETVLSDGLRSVSPESYGTLVLAGMGARLMLRILSDSPEKITLFSEYVFQPQSEDELMRRGLRHMGISITDETDLYEGTKYYHAMKCVKGDSASVTLVPGLTDSIVDRYGPCLLRKAGKATRDHIYSELNRYRKALSECGGSTEPGSSARLIELSDYVADCEKAYEYVCS